MVHEAVVVFFCNQRHETDLGYGHPGRVIEMGAGASLQQVAAGGTQSSRSFRRPISSLVHENKLSIFWTSTSFAFSVSLQRKSTYCGAVVMMDVFILELMSSVSELVSAGNHLKRAEVQAPQAVDAYDLNAEG